MRPKSSGSIDDFVMHLLSSLAKNVQSIPLIKGLWRRLKIAIKDLNKSHIISVDIMCFSKKHAEYTLDKGDMEAIENRN